MSQWHLIIIHEYFLLLGSTNEAGKKHAFMVGKIFGPAANAYQASEMNLNHVIAVESFCKSGY